MQVSYTPEQEQQQQTDVKTLEVGLQVPHMTDEEYESLDRTAGLGSFFSKGAKSAVKAVKEFVTPLSDVKPAEETGKGIRMKEKAERTKTEMEKLTVERTEDEPEDIADPKDILDNKFIHYDKDNKPSHQPRMDARATYKLEDIENDKDVDSAVQFMAERYANEIDEARRHTVGDDDANKLAKDIGVSKERMQELLTRPDGTTANVEEVFAMRKLMEESAVRLRSLAEQTRGGQATPEHKIQFDQAFLFHKDLLQKYMGYRAEAGRSLRAYGVHMGTYQNAEEQQNMLDLAMSGYDSQRVANIIAMSGDVKSVNEATNAMGFWRKTVETGTTNFVNSILSGISTQVVNTASGFMQQVTNGTDRLLASGGTRLRSTLGMNIEGMVAPEEASILAVGTFNSWRQAFKVASESFKTGVAYDGVGKFQAYKNPITSEYWGVAPDSNMGLAIDNYGKYTSFMVRNVMGGTDAFFKVLSEHGQYSALAYRNAFHDVRRLDIPDNQKQDELYRRTKDYLDNPTPTMIQESKLYAQQMTYMDTSETAVAITNLIKTQPWLRMFVPFINTPTSIFKQNLINRTPLAVFRPALYENTPQGQIARAQLTSGLLMMGGASYLVDAGLITGSEPMTYEGKMRWEAEGRKPHSIAVPRADGGTTYVSYARMENISYMLSMVSDLKQTMRVKEIDWEIENPELTEKIQDTVEILAIVSMKSMEDKTFVSGFDTLIDVVSGGRNMGESQDKLESAIGRIVVPAIIPMTGTMKDINWAFGDGYKKDTKEMADRLKTNLIYISKHAVNKLDYYGRDIKDEQRINPFKITYAEKDPFFRELDELYNETGEEAIYKLPRRVEGVELTSKEYHDMVKFVRNKKHDGENFQSVMTSFIKADEYKQLNPRAKVVRLANFIRAYDSQLTRAFIYQDAEIAERIAERIDIVNKRKGLTDVY